MKNAVLRGRPYAGNSHVRFDEGKIASGKPRRGSLLCKNTGMLTVAALLAMAATGAFAEGDWFREAGYGLFVHWGCYAVPAKGEWYLNGSQMDPDEYAKFADRFGAEKPSGYTKGKRRSSSAKARQRMDMI